MNHLNDDSVFVSSNHPLPDPRWQLAPVTFLLPHSGQSSATHRRHTRVSHITAQQPAAYRNQSSLLPLTPASPSCNLFIWTTKMQGCYKKMAAYQRVSVCDVNGTFQTDLHGRTRSLWNIQAKKAKREHCITIFINNCIKYVLLIILSQTVLRLALYGPILLPNHRVGSH